MTRIYNDPINGQQSSIGDVQFNEFAIQRKALQDAAEVAYFGQLASVINMPKHMGKTMKRYHYLPILDDRNINDQGIDALGVSLDPAKWYVFLAGAAVGNTAGYATQALAETASAGITDSSVQIGSGNLYGSSKDVGTVTNRFPPLTEMGGEVNRISNRRIEVEGSITKYGFHDKYTKASLDFDTDMELEAHIYREHMIAANQMTEAQLQVDLLAGAGAIWYGGSALAMNQVNGDDTTESLITYDLLRKIEIDLDLALCPKSTKMITGVRMIDTQVVNGARYMYIGSELIPTIKDMVNNFGQPAFIETPHYAAGSVIAKGEIGQIDAWKFIVVPEMLSWSGKGAVVGATNAAGNVDGYRTTTFNGVENYDVFPLLAVGSESFSSIGFQTDGKVVKFTIKHVKPESDISYALDKYGETGFTSIKWWFGSIIYRPEWIALAHTVAKL